MLGAYNYTDPSNDIVSCQFDPKTPTSSCDYVRAEVIKMNYVLPSGSTPMTVSIDWDKVSDSQSKANVLSVVDDGTQDEVYVGGYLRRTTMNPVSLQQFSGLDGTLRYSLWHNVGNTASFSEMVDVYAYMDTTNTYIYGCSNNVYVDGLIGIHVFSQASTTATPTTVQNLLLGTDAGSDYNNCFGIYGLFSSGSHNVYAVLKVSTEGNPLLMQLTITGTAYTLAYRDGNYATSSVFLNFARFISGRAYFVGTAY